MRLFFGSFTDIPESVEMSDQEGKFFLPEEFRSPVRYRRTCDKDGTYSEEKRDEHRKQVKSADHQTRFHGASLALCVTDTRLPYWMRLSP